MVFRLRKAINVQSPYARPLLKSNATFRYGMEYDEDYEFINNDPSKPAADHMKDENLSVKQLKMRYQGISLIYKFIRGRHGHDIMVFGFKTTCAINVYHH
jgi:hypothetical protein